MCCVLVFHRIYDGIATDESGLQQVLEASRKGPLVFCPGAPQPYGLLGAVLRFVGAMALPRPHIAAGANLAFFPLGQLFRGCGAFFLRRSFWQ